MDDTRGPFHRRRDAHRPVRGGGRVLGRRAVLPRDVDRIPIRAVRDALSVETRDDEREIRRARLWRRRRRRTLVPVRDLPRQLPRVRDIRGFHGAGDRAIDGGRGRAAVGDTDSERDIAGYRGMPVDGVHLREGVRGAGG